MPSAARRDCTVPLQCGLSLEKLGPCSVRAQADRRATRVQAHVRGYLTRTRFRKATELGRRQAARAAAIAAKHNAATAIQKHVRRRIAQRKARAGCSHIVLHLVRRLPPAQLL